MKTIKITLLSALVLLCGKSWSQVSVYENSNFGGKSHTYTEGIYALAGTIGNDVLSSVKVSPGWKVTLYEHDQSRGRSLVLNSDIKNLTVDNFDNITSNIKVERTGKGNTLSANQTLGANETLIATNGAYMLRMQEDDGHLCVYKVENGKQGAFVWGSGKHGFKNAKLVMQTDGNLVVSNGKNEPQWASNTHPYTNPKFKDTNNKPVKLVLENDGSLKLYNSSNQAVWTNK